MSLPKELDLTEGRGTGIPKILRSMKENGSPRPRFKTDRDHTFFATVLPIHPDAKAAAPDLHGPDTGQVAEPLRRVVESLDAEMTRQSLQGALGLGNRDHFRQAYLLPALEAGLIEMTVPDKPNSRSQQSPHRSRQEAAYATKEGHSMSGNREAHRDHGARTCKADESTPALETTRGGHPRGGCCGTLVGSWLANADRAEI